MTFVKVLATISALIFTIPLFFRRSREGTVYAKSDEKWVIIYLSAFVLGIFSSLLTLLIEDGVKFDIFAGKEIEIRLILFKVSLFLFLICLIWLIPYLFIFLKRDTITVIRNIRESIIDEFGNISSVGERVQEENLREKINLLERITLQALSNRNYLALDYAIMCFKDINSENMRRAETATKINNSIVKEIMRSLRDLSITCIENKSDEHSRQIGKHMKEIIMNGLRNHKNFEYPNLVLNIEKLGVEAARNHLEETTDEILNSLGQIGDQGIRTDLQRPPVLAVLKGLQNIGVVCIEEKMIHQCATARTRLLGIARLGDENIGSEALRRFWVITAYLYTIIPEMGEANYELETKLREEFSDIFTKTIDEAIEMLHKEGEWIQKRAVKEFKNTSKLFVK
ncbi:MAG: hypothetical protein HXS44_06990 [Theionarchaea archaeon]|nr:hypothetical protein [Theionarchaea archaeon]